MATATDKQLVEWAAAQYGTDPNVVFYIGEDESGFHDVPNKQGSGASGWDQFMPATFRAFAAKAKAAAPAAWKGIPVDIHNEAAQLLTTSWAIANGHGSDWATYSHALEQAAAAPVYSRTGTKVASAVTSTVNTIVNSARSVIGTPYVWGGESTAGFDCSGLVQWAFGLAGVKVPRTSQEQYQVAHHISADQAQPGDLVFFNNASHVGIYIGNGQMIDAPHTGADVRVENVWAGASYGRIDGVGGTMPDSALDSLGSAAGDVKDWLTDRATLGIPKAITAATEWIGKEIMVIAITAGAVLIGGALIIWGTITALGGDPKQTAGKAAAIGAMA